MPLHPKNWGAGAYLSNFGLLAVLKTKVSPDFIGVVSVPPSFITEMIFSKIEEVRSDHLT